MTNPTIYAPSVNYPAVPLAPQGNANGYPGFAPFAPAAPGSAQPAAFQQAPAQPTPAQSAATPQAEFQSAASGAAERAMNLLAMIGFIASFVGGGVVSIVLGAIGLKQIKAKNERGRGFAIASIILGSAGVLTFVLAVVLLVVAYMIGDALVASSSYSY